MLFILTPVVSGQVYADLTGILACGNGSTYYLRKIGKKLYWYGEKTKKTSLVKYILCPSEGNQINGNWIDASKGQAIP